MALGRRVVLLPCRRASMSILDQLPLAAEQLVEGDVWTPTLVEQEMKKAREKKRLTVANRAVPRRRKRVLYPDDPDMPQWNQASPIKEAKYVAALKLPPRRVKHLKDEEVARLILKRHFRESKVSKGNSSKGRAALETLKKYEREKMVGPKAYDATLKCYSHLGDVDTMEELIASRKLSLRRKWAALLLHAAGVRSLYHKNRDPVYPYVKAVITRLRDTGSEPDKYTYGAALTALSKAQEVDELLQFVDVMSETVDLNTVMLNSALSYLMDHRVCRRVFNHFVLKCAVHPDKISFHYLVKSALRLKNVAGVIEAERIVWLMEKGWDMTPLPGTAVLLKKAKPSEEGLLAEWKRPSPGRS